MSTLITNSDELTHSTPVFSKHDLAADIAPGSAASKSKPSPASSEHSENPPPPTPGSGSTPPATNSATPTTSGKLSNTWSRSTRWTTWSAKAASNHPRAHATDGVGSFRVN